MLLIETKMPVDVWTNPADHSESFGPYGQNDDNIRSNVINIIAHTLWLFAHDIHRHSNRYKNIFSKKNGEFDWGIIGQLTC